MNQFGNGYFPYGNNGQVQNMPYITPQQNVNNQNQMPSNSQPMSNCNFIMVKNANQVSDYIMNPGCKVYFMENNRPIMYMKTTNDFGLSEVKAYKFEEVDIEKLKNPQYDVEGSADTVSREEFSALMQEVVALRESVNELNKPRNNNQRNNDRRDKNESANARK